MKKTMHIDYNRAMTPILRTTWVTPPKSAREDQGCWHGQGRNVKIERSPKPDRNGNYMYTQTEPYVPQTPPTVLQMNKIEIHGDPLEGKKLFEQLSPRNSPVKNMTHTIQTIQD